MNGDIKDFMNIAEQLRGARGVLNWNQQDLADKSGVSKSAIVNIEKEKAEPEASTLRKLKNAIEREGVFTSDKGISKRDLFNIQFSTYLEVLEDIERALPQGGEVLIHCADDRKSSDAVNKKLKDLREKKIKFRTTICEGNTFVSGDIRDYRWIDRDYFAESEVYVIYSNRVVQHIADKEKSIFSAVVSDRHARRERKQFEYWWKTGKPVGGSNG